MSATILRTLRAIRLMTAISLLALLIFFTPPRFFLEQNTWMRVVRERVFAAFNPDPEQRPIRNFD
jgi:hypothetical protein